MFKLLHIEPIVESASSSATLNRWEDVESQSLNDEIQKTISF